MFKRCCRVLGFRRCVPLHFRSTQRLANLIGSCCKPKLLYTCGLVNCCVTKDRVQEFQKKKKSSCGALFKRNYRFLMSHAFGECAHWVCWCFGFVIATLYYLCNRSFFRSETFFLTPIVDVGLWPNHVNIYIFQCDCLFYFSVFILHKNSLSFGYTQQININAFVINDSSLTNKILH